MIPDVYVVGKAEHVAWLIAYMLRVVTTAQCRLSAELVSRDLFESALL